MNELLELIIGPTALGALAGLLVSIWKDRIGRNESHILDTKLEDIKSKINLNSAIKEREIQGCREIWESMFDVIDGILGIMGKICAHSQTGRQIVDYDRTLLSLYDQLMAARRIANRNIPFMDKSIQDAFAESYNLTKQTIDRIGDMLKENKMYEVDQFDLVIKPLLTPLERAIRIRSVIEPNK